MGLKIIAYGNILNETHDSNDIEFYKEMGFEQDSVVINPYFLHRCGDIIDPNVDYNDTSTLRKIGILMMDNELISEFKIDSYKEVKDFRDEIAMCFYGVNIIDVYGSINKGGNHRLIYADKPFFEFLDMSDVQGAIDCTNAKLIYADFVDNGQEFINYIENKYKEEEDNIRKIDCIIQMYSLWKDAFEIASNNGIVIYK